MNSKDQGAADLVAKEREAFEAHLGRMPTWAPEFEVHRGWVEMFAWDVWQARAALSSAPSALAAQIYDTVMEHFESTIMWQGNIPGDYERAQADHRERGIAKIAAIVGTPSKEGAAQVEAAEGAKPALSDAQTRTAFRYYDGRGEAQFKTPWQLWRDAAAWAQHALATPPASPSEGGGEQIAHIKQAIYTISGGDFDATDDEARRIAEAVLSLSPSRGVAVDAAKELLRAVELEMSPEWECNSYHPAIAPAVERLKAAIQSLGAQP